MSATCVPCQTVSCAESNDYELYSLQGLTTTTPEAAATTATCVTCQSIVCTLPNDYSVYSLQGLVPVQPSEQPQPAITNDRVSYCCTSSDATISYEGDLPSYLEFDFTNNCIYVPAGTYEGSSKAQANGTAQAALDVFTTAALADGSLNCSLAVLTLWYDDFEDYTDGEDVEGLDLGHWSNYPTPYVV